MATALSIPLLMTDGTAFPLRNIIVFITFVVIFVTLVFQGLLLPLVVRLINLTEIDPVIPEEEQQASIQVRLNKIAMQTLSAKYTADVNKNELVSFLKQDLERTTGGLEQQLSAMQCNETQLHEIERYQEILLHIYSLQRKELFQLRKEKFHSDEEIRKAELQLDLNELKIS